MAQSQTHYSIPCPDAFLSLWVNLKTVMLQCIRLNRQCGLVTIHGHIRHIFIFYISIPKTVNKLLKNWDLISQWVSVIPGFGWRYSVVLDNSSKTDLFVTSIF